MLQPISSPTGAPQPSDFGFGSGLCPKDPENWIERPELAKQIAERLERPGRTALVGLSGTGKSYLAARFFLGIRRTHPIKMCFLSLDSDTQDTRIRSLIRQLGQPVPDNSSELRYALAGAWVARPSGFLLLDNCISGPELAELLPPQESCWRVIATSQNAGCLYGIGFGEPIEVESFTTEQSLKVMRRVLGGAFDSQRDDCEKLCKEDLGNLPIAVVAAAVAISKSHRTVANWRRRFKKDFDLLKKDIMRPGVPRDDLHQEALNLGIVRVLFTLSLEDLRNEPDREIAAMAWPLLIALSLFDADRGGLAEHIASVAGFDGNSRETALAALKCLKDRSLINSLGADESERYTMHRLMARVVQEIAAKPIGEEAKRIGLKAPASENKGDASANIIRAARQEFIAFWARFSANKERDMSGSNQVVAFRAFKADEPNLNRAIDFCLDPDFGATFKPSLVSLAIYAAQWMRGFGDRSRSRQLLQKALPLTDPKSEMRANVLQALGDLDVRESRLEDARNHYNEAEEIYTEIGYRLGLANVLQALGELDVRESRLKDARNHYKDAEEIYREIGPRLGLANVLRASGDLARLENRLSEARALHDSAMVIYKAINERMGQANVLLSLGDLEVLEKRPSEARKRYEEALTIYEEIEDAWGKGNVLNALRRLSELRKRR